jgi:hypothetical protein
MLVSMSPKQRYNVFLEPEHLEGLRAIQEATGATPSEQIRRAIDRWIEENGPKGRPTPKPSRGPQQRGRGRSR